MTDDLFDTGENELDALVPRPSTKASSAIAMAEEQIVENIRDVRYIVREYPTEVVVHKYLKGRSNDKNEIFVPDYQRDLVWPDKNQSKFIESILIGLPVPFLFVADVSGEEDPDKAGRLEIVDGVQRIRTLARFMTGELVLGDLERLNSLNGFSFFDLHPSRQRRFGRATLRLIELTETVTEDVRRDMFDRINSGSVGLEAVEVRRGIQPGPFLTLTTELANDPRLHTLAPVSDAMKRRFEYEEFVTRYFAFMDRYESYGIGGKIVKNFLLAYVKDTNKKLKDEPSYADVMRSEWNGTISFIEHYLPEGFKKSGPGRKVPRVRFEAISVGVGLALREKPDLGKLIGAADRRVEAGFELATDRRRGERSAGECGGQDDAGGKTDHEGPLRMRRAAWGLCDRGATAGANQHLGTGALLLSKIVTPDLFRGLPGGWG